MRHLLLFFLLLVSFLSEARPAPADSLRRISPDRLLSYTYANDLYFRTDYYFTQGMTLTLVHPALAHLPTQRLLPGISHNSTQYHGITLRYDGFTPLRIQDDFIRVGDRPYAAYIYASFFRVSSQATQRLTTALELGLLGPATGAEEFQTAIHRRTNNPTPRGWRYQIGNAPVIGYRALYERQVFSVPGHVEMLGQAEASLSTLYTYAGLGLRLRAGFFNSYFANLGVASRGQRSNLRRWQCYGQATLESRFIGYDATLQGSLWPGNDPYTLAAGAVRRAVLRGSGSLVLAHNGFQLSATATWLTPEFAGARRHAWTQLGITKAF
ncbi:lipid A deacylase LpxR family protein [Hymenobacter sp. ASUV-10]|uniref:Lipid A deacylase LpxR family protein n=1 Tax=Hymenobacter aranciens TaxID=3063996 RepID=A0ABT9BDS5_9BACT|nr:lipid A deacylase LpxR family protein [Hymenobacter sp. ASUV-10]MDO7874841.1 lipid A deacylase LpxR family protein [Hymenobacter sp. ASUV-10]